MTTEPRTCDFNEEYESEPDYTPPMTKVTLGNRSISYFSAMPPKITEELLAKLDEYYRNRLGSFTWERRQRTSDWRLGNSLSMELHSFTRYHQLQDFCAALDQTISAGLICSA